MLKINRYIFSRLIKKEFGKLPIPLYDQDRKIVYMWSAKSGCTFVAKWFFYQLNLLKDAEDFHPWIHNYKEQIFYNSEYIRKLSHDFINNRVEVVYKFVRNPYDRTVSSYLMLLRWLSWEDKRPEYIFRPIEQFLGRPILNSIDNSLSFAEFVLWLKSIDVNKVDMHFKPQIGLLEKKSIIDPTIIKLENSIELIPELEKKHSYQLSEFSQLRENVHDNKKVDFDQWVGAKRMIFSMEKTPVIKNFYNDDLRVSIGQIYKRDFHQYDYEI